ncbi:MAG: hypothetical protein ACPG31_11660 [Planctomycetota bacterium]
MSPRFLTALLIGALVVLPACSGGSKKTEAPLSATVSGTGPQVSDNAPPPPPPPTPDGNQTVYQVHIVEQASGNPIGGAFGVLLREMPEPEYMRVPARRSVISEYRTPLHGQWVGTADADSKPKWILITGSGFDPFITELAPAAPGQIIESTIRIAIVPVCEFIVIQPDGDRADNAIVTMKPDVSTPDPEGKMGGRVGSGNIGTTERADDFGLVKFNRAPGTYQMTYTDSKGRYRKYEKFTWTGTQDAPVKIQLPGKSETTKPW